MSDDEEERREMQRCFSVRMRDVVREEERNTSMSDVDQERLFRKVAAYLENPDKSIGLHTITKLAFAPATIPATRLEEMAAVICDKLFQPVAYTDEQILKYTDFYLCFAYLEGTKTDGEESKIETFEEAFIESFLSKLGKRFANRGDSQSRSTNIDGYEEEKGTGDNTGKQDLEKVVDRNSIRFLQNVQKLYPAILFKVFEFLLSNFGGDTLAYLDSLLTPQTVVVGNSSSPFRQTLGWTNEIGLMCAVVDMGKMMSGNVSTADMFRSRYLPKMMTRLKCLSDSRQRVMKLADKRLRDPALKHRLSHSTFCQQLTPQDFIKLSLAAIARFRIKNDFEIDDEDEGEDDHSPVAMLSVNFSPGLIMPFNNCYEWRGLKVHSLTK